MLKTSGNIVLVGVGGSGVSALAYCLYELGYTNIVGINDVDNQITDALKTLGITIIIGHGQYQVKSDDTVIYSNGGAAHSPEVQQSREYQQQLLNIYHRPYSYAQFLGEISKYFKTIGFAGTNGKSTCTSLGIYTFSRLSDDFGLGIVGALVPQFGGRNILINPGKKSDLRRIMDAILTGKQVPYELIKQYRFLIEADEYKHHFLELDLEYSLITNIELDHSDVYKDLEDYRHAFEQLVLKTKRKIYGHQGDSELMRLQQITPDGKEKFSLHALINQELTYLFGVHNQYNATLVASSFADILQIDDIKKIYEIMQQFKGLRRRMECLGATQSGAIVYTDYGHYPTSLDHVIKALRSRYADQRIVAIFQPHQARRILEGRTGFVSALSHADESIIYNLYAAREEITALKQEFATHDLHHIHSFDELGDAFALACQSSYTTDLSHIVQCIQKADSNTVIVIFTAGDLDYELRNLIDNKQLQLKMGSLHT